MNSNINNLKEIDTICTIISEDKTLKENLG